MRIYYTENGPACARGYFDRAAKASEDDRTGEVGHNDGPVAGPD